MTTTNVKEKAPATRYGDGFKHGYDARDAELAKTRGVELLATLRKVNLGAQSMTKQQFRNVLRKSIRASKEYADGCWVPFKDYTIGYLCNRNPEAQAVALIEKCLEIADRERKR